jgi:hypothetical protein
MVVLNAGSNSGLDERWQIILIKALCKEHVAVQNETCM